MKKLLLILLVLISLSGYGQDILKFTISSNYLVVENETQSTTRRFPKGSVSYNISGSNVVLYESLIHRLRHPAASIKNPSDVFFNTTTIAAWLDTNTGTNVVGIPTDSVYSNYTGWAVYNDGAFTTGSPFSVGSGSKVTLPNNSATSIESQLPTDVSTFYNSTDSLITGRNGDGVSITIEFSVRPTTAASNVRVRTTIDIGGAVGEIYPYEFQMTKGQNVEHYFLEVINGYTLGTWEANGGKVKVEAINGPIEIYTIRYVVTRTHKAR